MVGAAHKEAMVEATGLAARMVAVVMGEVVLDLITHPILVTQQVMELKQLVVVAEVDQELPVVLVILAQEMVVLVS